MSQDQERFSPEGYKSLIAAGRSSGYHFVTYGDVAEAPHRPGRLCLMRHDVDVNVHFALELARIEAEERIKSTYFMMLRSPAYNLLGRASALAVREIVALGHEIGVHFDAQHPIVTRDNLVELVMEEARIISGLAERPVPAVSFHQPSDYVLDSDIEIPGLINTYHRRQLAGWHYMSDSNRDWRGQSPWQLLPSGENDRVQILTHPMWWVCDAAATEAAWDQAVLDNFETMQRQFLDTERAYGPRRALSVEHDVWRK